MHAYTQKKKLFYSAALRRQVVKAESNCFSGTFLLKSCFQGMLKRFQFPWSNYPCGYARKITDIRVKLSVQTRISVENRAPISVASITARISAWIYRSYGYKSATFTLDIQGYTDNSTRTSVILRISKRISKWISRRISARTVQPGLKIRKTIRPKY